MDDFCIDDTRPRDHQRTDARIGQLVTVVGGDFALILSASSYLEVFSVG